jgi:hypothetical protein
VDDAATWRGLLAETAREPSEQPARICELCVERLDVDGAGISMVSAEGNRGVVCATDGVARAIEELQLTVGEGPCVDAVRSGAPVLIFDLRATEELDVDRWPAFMRASELSPVRALFVFPLRVGAINVGALDLYRIAPGELASADLTGALLAADAAALALLGLDDPGGVLSPGSLDMGATNQVQIHQATGVVQAQMHVTTEQAFLLLRARAFADGRRLSDLAADVVARRHRFSKDDA